MDITTDNLPPNSISYASARMTSRSSGPMKSLNFPPYSKSSKEWEYASRRANCGAPWALNDRGERRLRRLVKSDPPLYRRYIDCPNKSALYQKAIQYNCAAHSIAYWPSQQTLDFSTHVDKRASQETSCIYITAQTLDPRTVGKSCFFRLVSFSTALNRWALVYSPRDTRKRTSRNHCWAPTK
ncbi:hypothetical protein AVEN_158655-1 [Araneus ventricosus]|uniref:Uncharacterized protein n=1 Tax=Araneus ventricosus TaxID=182803 RepID=A0A4Y2QWC9_ARAVE|nr:hypothetical protein AVEN_158655-1 [Araneus ventricosus]